VSVLTIDAGAHCLIHPSVSTLQPAPAFLRLLRLLAANLLNSCRLAQVPLFPPAWGWSASNEVPLRVKAVFPTRVGMVDGDPGEMDAGGAFRARMGAAPLKLPDRVLTFRRSRRWRWPLRYRGSRRESAVAFFVRACLNLAGVRRRRILAAGKAARVEHPRKRAVTTEPTPPTAKRTAARRVCAQTASLGIFRPALRRLAFG